MKPKLHDANYWINRPMNSEKDWIDDAPNWVESYVLSVDHPHRQLILDELEKLDPVDTLLEIGSNTGANLLRITEEYPEIRLIGIDVSKKCVAKAIKYVPNGFFKIGDYHTLPFPKAYVDLILADAVLMYSSPKQIYQAISEIDRVTRKYVIIVDRLNKSKKGVRSGHVWARDYPRLLEKLGYKVKTTMITQKDWPDSVGWAKDGVIIVAEK